MADEVSICNRALQRLGAKRITSLTQDTPNARSCNFAYEHIRDSELRAHPWSCAIKRAQLAADATAPLFGKTARFPLPSDFIRLLPLDPSQNDNTFDYQIEAGYIYTDYSAPLNIRYIYRLEDPNTMDSLFREALSMRLAMELCEEITQSNTKFGLIEAHYNMTVKEAKRVNAIERIAQMPPEDTWITVRS